MECQVHIGIRALPQLHPCTHSGNFKIYDKIKAIKREVVTETWDSSFLDTSIVYKKFDFRNKTFLYWKIHKNGRVKHCSSYLILWSKFHFQVFKFTFLKVVIDFVIIWRILILAICLILILWKNLMWPPKCMMEETE